ncbi:MAG TPA: STAS domain-containing protein [Streptosporangiaceae bacterium]|nr:STAS domain-containing protein [Streptosporangiaceae bacterium]
MSDSRYPIQLVRGVPVIAAPATLDLHAATLLRTTLLHLAAAGHVTVVIDMSATTACDAAGQAELARAYKHAAAEGGDLRLVADARALSDVLADSGLDRVISQFPSVAAAVAETPAVRIVPFGPGAAPRRHPPRQSPRQSGSRPLPIPLPVR